MSNPSFHPGDSIRAKMKRAARELDEFRARDPEGYAAHIKEVRQRGYRLTGRNPDGTPEK